MISVHLPRSQTWEKPAWLPRPLFVPHPWVLCCFRLMRFVVNCWGQILILLILWRPKGSKLQAIRWLLNRVTAEKWQMHAPSVHQQELVGTHFLRPCRKRSKLVFWMVCKLRFVSQRFSSLCWQTCCYYCCCITVIHVFPLHQLFPGCGHLWTLPSRNLQSTLVRFTEDGCVGAGCDFQLSIEPLTPKGLHRISIFPSVVAVSHEVCWFRVPKHFNYIVLYFIFFPSSKSRWFCALSNAQHCWTNPHGLEPSPKTDQTEFEVT